MVSGKRARAPPSDEELESTDDESTGSSSEAESTTSNPPLKKLQLDIREAQQPAVGNVINCTLPPHGSLDFSSYAAFETHYEQNHVNRCAECGRNLPSNHYLQLHIAENHDPFMLIRKERGERTFSCFVDGCDRKTSTAYKRRLHSIDKHGFPKDYDFYIVNDGIGNRTSMLRQVKQQHIARKSREDREEAGSASFQKRDHGDSQNEGKSSYDPVSSLTTSMSALDFVPRNLKFGKGASKTFSR